MSDNFDKVLLPVSYYYRTQYEQCANNPHVPVVIKAITSKYFRKHLPSKLLSIQSDLKLFDAEDGIWEHTFWYEFNSFKLLYQASEHNFSAQKFHEITDDHPDRFGEVFATITLIEDNWGNLFGAYVNKTWKIESTHGTHWNKDRYSLLFVIKSHQSRIDVKTPFFFTPKEGHEDDAILCWPQGGPSFGYQDIVIGDKGNATRISDDDGSVQYSCWSKLSTFENKSYPDVKLCGGCEIMWDPYDSTNWVYGFKVKEYEVWQVLR